MLDQARPLPLAGGPPQTSRLAALTVHVAADAVERAVPQGGAHAVDELLLREVEGAPKANELQRLERRRGGKGPAGSTLRSEGVRRARQHSTVPRPPYHPCPASLASRTLPWLRTGVTLPEATQSTAAGSRVCKRRRLA